MISFPFSSFFLSFLSALQESLLRKLYLFEKDRIIKEMLYSVTKFSKLPLGRSFNKSFLHCQITLLPTSFQKITQMHNFSSVSCVSNHTHTPYSNVQV